MLTYLSIENFALISRLDLDLGPGLTALTGETGAGKSIILAAVGLLLGQRASADLIRAGADQATVQAQFQVPPDSAVHQALEEAGCPAEDGELVLRRVVSSQGKNRVLVNGALAPLALLARIGPELMSVVGQHASQALLRPEEHLLLLDAFAGLDEARGAVGRAVAGARAAQRRLDELARRLEEREERRDELARLVRELEDAALDPNEEDALRRERRQLANAEELSRLAGGVHQGLYAADGSVLENLDRVRGLLGDLADLDASLAPMAARVEEAYYTLEDAAHEARDYASAVVYDPARLDWIEGRLTRIQRTARKHGGDVEAALAVLARAREELADLDGGDLRLRELARERDRALDGALDLAGALAELRREAASRLAAAVQEELKGLGMAACQVQPRFGPPGGGVLDTPRGALGPRGLESLELFIAPNPGEGFRPLARIASGGELSRLLLALRTLVARSLGADTLVFDEVDAGIGGNTGTAVGRKLAALAAGAQVLVITHLPQIAAWADTHFTVGKEVAEGRTATVVRPLAGDERRKEMARMLSEAAGEATAQEHARGLLEAARREKSAG